MYRITMFQLLFQQFDYESMYDSNKVFGVIYFIGVVLLLIFLLMVTNSTQYI